MSILSENLRYLRAQKNFSQQALADNLLITRGRYSKYEEDASEPPLDVLQRIAHYFHVSIDLLISVDLRKVPMEELLKLEGNRILLPIKTDQNGDNYIEIIPHKAKAGYLNSYSDPEYIESMQHISLPFLKEGKFRAFPIEGDSMPPHQDGSFIIAKFIEGHREVKIGKTYVLLTLNEGIVYKRIAGKEKKSVLLSSDNAFYEPYQVKFSEILEIWEYASSIATKEFEPDDLNAESIKSMFVQLKRDIAEIKEWK